MASLLRFFCGRPASGSGASALPGQGNHLLNRRTRGSGSGPLNEDGEFDFEAGLAKFDKEKVGLGGDDDVRVESKYFVINMLASGRRGVYSFRGSIFNFM